MNDRRDEAWVKHGIVGTSSRAKTTANIRCQVLQN